MGGRAFFVRRRRGDPLRAKTFRNTQCSCATDAKTLTTPPVNGTIISSRTMWMNLSASLGQGIPDGHRVSPQRHPVIGFLTGMVAPALRFSAVSITNTVLSLWNAHLKTVPSEMKSVSRVRP